MRRMARSAFTLLETMVALGVTAIGLAAFYAASAHAIHLAKTGKQFADANALLQERIETIRSAPGWSNISTTAGVQALIAPAAVAAGTFAGATETVSVSAYPAATPAFTVTRSSGGAFTTTGAASLAAQKCLKVTVQVNWSGQNNRPFSRRISTVVSKEGV
jgi:prepilin-type N-terminal cleavage/methylation domain-containing protein